MFNFSTAPLPVRPDLSSAFTAVWESMASPGTWWNGEERVAIARTARAEYQGEESSDSALGPAATAAAKTLSRTPSATTSAMIASWETDGLSSNHYVELIGVVSRLVAVDTFCRGLGVDLKPLPNPEPGEPSHTSPETPATKTKAWVPMVGPATIPTALSAVPAEMDALEPLHGSMYLAYTEMGDPDIQRGLHRSQMELVASRTSAINECFF